MRQVFAAILLGGMLLVGGTAAHAAGSDDDPWMAPQVVVPLPIGQIQIAPLVPFDRHGDTAGGGIAPAGPQ